MIKSAGIDFKNLPEEYDSPLGLSSGAAVIFGVTGGVMKQLSVLFGAVLNEV